MVAMPPAPRQVRSMVSGHTLSSGINVSSRPFEADDAAADGFGHGLRSVLHA